MIRPSWRLNRHTSGEWDSYATPLLVGSLQRAATMVMSMETRAFGAFTHRTLVDAPRMGAGARLFSADCLVGARALVYVHTIYVFAPG